jgi:hypothetical protein
VSVARVTYKNRKRNIYYEAKVNFGTDARASRSRGHET